jgi:hypothetical protein
MAGRRPLVEPLQVVPIASRCRSHRKRSRSAQGFERKALLLERKVATK